MHIYAAFKVCPVFQGDSRRFDIPDHSRRLGDEYILRSMNVAGYLALNFNGFRPYFRGQVARLADREIEFGEVNGTFDATLD